METPNETTLPTEGVERASSSVERPMKSHALDSSDEEAIGFEIDLDSLPKGYYTSRFFIGSMLATGIGLWAGVSAFGYAAPILGHINEDIGPDPRYTWISLVYNAALAVCLAPVGRLSDIFGRRYWFIGGGILAVAGSIICATAKSIPVLIGGNVLLGVASATQLSFHFVMGELVPVKYRYMGNAFLYIFSIPGSGMGPSIAYAFIQRYPSVGWRGIYWLLLGANGTALACWVLFYFPPSFNKKHRGEEQASVAYWVRNFDYVGTSLFAVGFVVFLLGLSWGGNVYPWKSAATIASIVLGTITLIAFVLWEIYAPIKEPLVPMHLFKNVEWVAAVILLGLGAGVYYAFAIIWPMQVTVLYGDGKSLDYIGAVSNIIGLGMIGGQITGGALAKKIGKTRYQVMGAFAVGAIFLACAAVATPDNKNTAIALIFLGCFWIGWNESVCLSNSTICVHDQRDIGIAGGMAGSIRAAICAVLVAIYSSILTNRLTTTISTDVPAALVGAGLPASSVADFIAAISAGTADAFAAVPGISDAIVAVGLHAYKVANADAYRTVYLSTIAFSGVALAMSWYAPNTESLMTENVAATLHNEETLEEKEMKPV